MFLLKIEEVEESDIPDFLKTLVEDVVKYAEELFGKLAGEQGLFMKTTVHQLLFGYDDPILTELNKFVNNIARLFPEFKKYAPNPFFGLEVRTYCTISCTPLVTSIMYIMYNICIMYMMYIVMYIMYMFMFRYIVCMLWCLFVFVFCCWLL